MSRWRSPEYLRWVASLPCASCKIAGLSQAHHFKGIGNMGGTGLKAPDYWAMPLCQACHDGLHARMDRAAVRSQYEWAARTLGFFFEQMAESLGDGTMKTLVRGVCRVDVIGGRS